METHEFTRSFEMDGLILSPTHVRIEQLSPIIAAHRHSNSSYEIHYTAHGRGRVLIGEAAYAVEPGTVYVTGPNVLHAQFSDALDPMVEYCLYLNCRSARRPQGTGALSPFQNTHFWIGSGQRLSALMLALIEERRRRLADMEEMSEALLREIVVTLNRSYRSDSGEAESALGRTSQGDCDESRLYPLVEDAFFYGYQTLRLGDLARLLNRSVRQTQRFLLNHYGKSFTQKRTDAQMAAAAELLRNSALSVTQIAEQTGFSSAEHFSTAFRRYYTCPPSTFRKRNG